MSDRIRQLLKRPFSPIGGYFGPRFGFLRVRMDQIEHRLLLVQNRLDEFEQSIKSDIGANLEILTLLERAATGLESRLNDRGSETGANSPSGSATGSTAVPANGKTVRHSETQPRS